MLSAKKPRTARALANDRLIREAGVAEILRVGVDQLSLRDVGQRAGFTHGATYARYEDVDELVVDLWASVLCERATLIMGLCRRAAERPSRGPGDRRAPRSSPPVSCRGNAPFSAAPDATASSPLGNPA